MPPTTSAPHSAKLAIAGGTPVSTQPVPFMAPVLNDADIEAAVKVLRSGMLRQAARCAEFELRWAEMTSARHAMTCANGTCALQLAYGATIKPGDDVIVPAWTYMATVSMIVAAGARPVFCDVREDTFNIDTVDATRRITPKTTAIACTHLYGNPADIDGVQALAAKHGLRVIYDAAQSHLARYRGKGLGEFGDAVTYSFYATKNIATGEGGMVTTNDDAIAKSIRLLRSHGETDKYLHESIGFNYRMTDVEAAIGCSQLDRLEANNQKRRDAAARYDAILAEIPGLIAPTTTPGSTPVYHLYTVKMDLARFNCTRDQFIEALKAEGVPTAVHYPRALPRQPALAPFATDHPPISDGLSKRVFCLPMHPALSHDHVRIVGEALSRVAAFYRA